MELESESSVVESVEDNGLVGEIEDKPVETCSPPVSKGYGLRKWKRRVRRDLVKDDYTSVSKENSKILKRVLSGAADSQAKQMHFPEQESIGSVGSVNSVVGFAIGGASHGGGLAYSAGVDSDNSEDRSSKSSTAASGPKVRYERAKNLGGKGVVIAGEQRKSRVDNSKKIRGERIKIEKENSHSSMESADSRSSNFVFMQGVSFTLSSREQGVRRSMMTDYNDEENSDHDAHNTSNRKDYVGGDEEDHSQGESVEESQIKNNGSSDNLDSLTEAFDSFHTLQEALKKELEKFQELGKEPISSSLHNVAESSSCIHGASEASSSRLFGSENIGETGLPSLDSEILNLVNNVEHLEIKLVETKSMLEVKESLIRELVSHTNVSEPRNQETEIGIEEIFKQKMEAEIEYIIFSRSVDNLNRRIKVIEEDRTLAENEAHKMLSKLGEAETKAETKAENLKNQAQDLQNHCVEITEIQEVKSFKKRMFKATSCLVLQLGLMFMLFSFQFKPESETFVPT